MLLGLVARFDTSKQLKDGVFNASFAWRPLGPEEGAGRAPGNGNGEETCLLWICLGFKSSGLEEASGKVPLRNVLGRENKAEELSFGL